MLISIRYLGKTTFLFYALLHRLEKELPTAIQLGPRYYFKFDEQGAKVCLHDHYSEGLEQCWALVDSNATLVGPSHLFQTVPDRVILTSSPKPKRYKEWIKQTMGAKIISDLPSVPEIAAIV
jgi:hypothetical protein